MSSLSYKFNSSNNGVIITCPYGMLEQEYKIQVSIWYWWDSGIRKRHIKMKRGIDVKYYHIINPVTIDDIGTYRCINYTCSMHIIQTDLDVYTINASLVTMKIPQQKNNIIEQYTINNGDFIQTICPAHFLITHRYNDTSLIDVYDYDTVLDNCYDNCTGFYSCIPPPHNKTKIILDDLSTTITCYGSNMLTIYDNYTQYDIKDDLTFIDENVFQYTITNITENSTYQCGYDGLDHYLRRIVVGNNEDCHVIFNNNTYRIEHVNNIVDSCRIKLYHTINLVKDEDKLIHTDEYVSSTLTYDNDTTIHTDEYVSSTLTYDDDKTDLSGYFW
jgi:hypothetical protein